MTDPRREESPEVLDALQGACAAARSANDPELLELARRRVAMLLGAETELGARPWGDVDPEKLAALAEWATSSAFDDPDRAALALVEQFVIDVTGVASGPLGPAAGALGDRIVPFVQSLYLLDVGQRLAVVLGRLFGTTITSDDWAWPADGGSVTADPMDAVMAILAAVGRLREIDPVTKELVRLRGARLHRCRRCQSVRSVAAIEAGAGLDLLAAEDLSSTADLPTGTRAAIDLVDATFVGQPSLDDELFGRLTQSFDATELVEIADYLLRNATTKVAVAFGADEAIVDEGYEYQVIDESGETVTVDSSVIGTVR